MSTQIKDEQTQLQNENDTKNVNITNDSSILSTSIAMFFGIFSLAVAVVQLNLDNAEIIIKILMAIECFIIWALLEILFYQLFCKEYGKIILRKIVEQKNKLGFWLSSIVAAVFIVVLYAKFIL